MLHASAEELLVRLRATDDQVRQGRIDYETHYQLFVPPVDIEAEVCKAVEEAKARGDSTRHAAERARMHATISNSIRDCGGPSSLMWTADGRIRIENLRTTIEDSTYAVAFHPEEADGRTRKVISEAAAPDYAPFRFANRGPLSLFPGPCFPLGRGLPSMEGSHIEEDAEGAIVVGEIPWGTVRARLDPEHGSIARSIEITTRVQEMFQRTAIMLSEPLLSADGAWVPGLYVEELWKVDGSLHSRNEVRMRTADFREPDPELFVWHLEAGERVQVTCDGEAVVYECLPAELTDPAAVVADARERVRTGRRYVSAPGSEERRACGLRPPDDRRDD